MTLGDEEAKRRGVQKTVLERAGPPTFDATVRPPRRLSQGLPTMHSTSSLPRLHI